MNNNHYNLCEKYGYFRYNPWASNEWVPPLRDFYDCLNHVKGLSKIYFDEENSHKFLLHLLQNVIQPYNGLVILNLNDLGYKPEVVLDRLETIMDRGIYLFDLDNEIDVKATYANIFYKKCISDKVVPRDVVYMEV